MNADGDVTPDRSCCHTSCRTRWAPPVHDHAEWSLASAPDFVLGNGAHLQTTPSRGYVRDGELLQAATMLSKLYVEICSVPRTHRETQPGRAQSTGERSRQPIARVRPNSAANTRRSALRLGDGGSASRSTTVTAPSRIWWGEMTLTGAGCGHSEPGHDKHAKSPGSHYASADDSIHAAAKPR